MYAKALLMTSLAWQWWTHSLASVGGGVAWKPMLKHELDYAVFLMILFCQIGFGGKYWRIHDKFMLKRH